MAVIGNVSEIYLLSYDALGNQYKTNISKGFSINPNGEVTYEQIDTAQRALCNLSSNTYDDTTLVTNISVNEKLAEE